MLLNPLSNARNYFKNVIESDKDYFTSLGDIAREVEHHKDCFKGKRVLCCCHDDVSAFGEYFMSHFDELGLQELILVSHTDDEVTADVMVDMLSSEKVSISTVSSGKAVWTDKLTAVDVVVTNPPSKLIGSMIRILTALNKQFLLVANINSAMYKDVLPAFVNDEVWLGVTRPRKFHVGAKGFVEDEKPIIVGNMVWLTNLENDVQRPALVLTQKVSDPENAGKYLLVDNTDILWISHVKDIPMDWDGRMAVPVNFLQRYNRGQFKIVGSVNHGYGSPLDFAAPKVNGEAKYKHLVIVPIQKGGGHQ